LHAILKKGGRTGRLFYWYCPPPDAALRKRILVDNPAKPYSFG
jgi:hypothetical protein